MLHRLYAWILGIAAGPNALQALLLVSFAESSVFPVPPDILLIPMILARPRDAWRLAAYCTLASVIGGLLGYAIGYFLFDTIGRPVLEFYHAMDRYDALKAGFDQWGVWIIILKGMTPIPYKLMLTTRVFAGFVLMASAVVLGTALLSQYWGGLAPCELCLLQRWPWAVAIVISLVVVLVGERAGLAWVALLLGLVFVISVVLAFY